ncbi:NUDIX hydrolase [Pseudoroseicyclus tamaricis]|uniref:NUDIX hydrolase n=1 Tax=Pseudoroseicyclus tamaricis TaxID=2705421 RepID=A0A6B2JM96_9RHOB|nr:NUDIX hydrolase [Pseudoroseicyclus tamaricis]NDV02713.1 NUDIX hydrolase [Pseudoroseicyclus tamaricis]
MRRLGERVDPAQTYRARPGAYAVLPRGGALLLTRTEEFLLPGGGIDPGESPLQALHREVMEETGWRIAAPRRIGAFRRFVFMPDYGWWAEKICHIYVARPVLRLGPPTEPDHEPVWMAPELAADLLGSPVDRFVVAGLQERA